MRKGQVFIGTSGWIYKHWKGVFYPQSLSQTQWLAFYTKHFDTVELNASFYRIPSESNFLSWKERTPTNFSFSLKMSRYVSRVQRLQDNEGSTELFLKKASALKEKLKVVLVQLPPNLPLDLETLENYLGLLKKVNQQKVRFAFEFRHESWFQSGTYLLLKKFNSALVIAQSNRWPAANKITADFVYLRFHGPGDVYGSNYSEAVLKQWAKKIREWQKVGLDIFAYFNNDARAYAVNNARKLKALLA